MQGLGSFSTVRGPLTYQSCKLIQARQLSYLFHRRRQLIQVNIHVQTMRFRERVQGAGCGPANAVLDAAKLAVGESGDLALREAGGGADFAAGGAIAAVEVRAALLGLAQLGRVHRLQELAPAQMNIEVRPVDEGTIGVNSEVLQHSWRLIPKRGEGGNRDVQHPMLRAANEKRVPDKVGVDDAAADAILTKSGADPPEQIGHVWNFQFLNPHYVKSIFRADFYGPHPLGDLAAARVGPGKEKVEGPGNHFLHTM